MKISLLDTHVKSSITWRIEINCRLLFCYRVYYIFKRLKNNVFVIFKEQK